MRPVLPVVALSALALSASLSRAVVTTFDNGTEGWQVVGPNDGSQGDFLRDSGGSPGANLQFSLVDTFGASFHNNSNAAFTGDLSRYGTSVTLGIDLKVNSIDYSDFGGFFHTAYEVPRNLIVELVNNNPDGSDYPYTSVWYDLGQISSTDTGDWTHFSVTIPDTSATALPAGWGGYGAEDALGNPLLPADRTFASVLAHVDELRFTTYEPGYFYGFTAFDLQYDNPSLSPAVVPEPAATSAALLPSLALLRRRRTRRA